MGNKPGSTNIKKSDKDKDHKDKEKEKEKEKDNKDHHHAKNTREESGIEPPTPRNQETYSEKDRAKEANSETEVANFLKNVPLLSKLNDSERKTLAAHLSAKSFPAKTVIIKEGDKGEGFYIIREGGDVIVSKEGNEIGRLRPGDYFGEAALLSDAKRGATVTSTDAIKCWYLERKDFNALFSKDKLNVQFAKRQAISAEDADQKSSTGNHGSTSPKNKDKDKKEQTVTLIMNAIKDNVLFSDMLPAHKQKVVAEMYRTEVKTGTSVINQGERGDHLYVVETGEFHIFVNKVHVATRKAGTVFGELALMYNAPRAATVTAAADSVVWIVDRYTFRRIVTDAQNKTFSQYIGFLNKVQLLQPLAQYERDKIAEAIEEVTVDAKFVVMKQRDEGDCMYIVHHGNLTVTKKEEGETEFKEVLKLTTGDVFGERALMKNEKRAATVTADTECSLLRLPEESFRLLLGPLEDILNHKLISYDSKLDPVALQEIQEKKEQQEEEKKIPYSDLRVIGTLGKGSFGYVQLVKDVVSKQTFALKAVSKAQIVQTGQQGHIMSEKKVMQSLKHPFCIRLHNTYKDKNRLYFLLEPSLGGELFSVLRARTLFDEDTARFYAGSVVLAFEYMHSKNIIYRDLKPENLLLDDRGFLKVTDFGFAKELLTGRTWTLCGTPDYLAPEIVAGKGHGKGVDWWTLGVFIYEMLASYPPFYDEDPMKTYAKIMHGNITFPSHFSKEAVNLVQKLLHHKPTKRLGVVKGGAKLIKKHAWFKNFDFDKLYNREVKPPIVPKIKGPDDLGNFDQFNDEPPKIESYEDDGSNWDAEF